MAAVVVLTGGPGCGKSTIAGAVARLRRRCAVVEVDDVRQLLRQPHAAPWEGAEGRHQQLLGVHNAVSLALAFHADGTDVVVADVLNDETLTVYRTGLGHVPHQILMLRCEFAEASARAESRHYALTPDQFRMLHDQQRRLDGVDGQIDTSCSSVDESAAVASRLLDELSQV